MVLVSHSHKFIFLKTRKTAGTSVEMMLEPACAPKDHTVQHKTPGLVSEYGIVGARMSTPAHGVWKNHILADHVRDQLGAEQFDSYKKITTIRNPFDRMMSMFMWRHAKNNVQSRTLAEIREAFGRYVQKAGWQTDRYVTHVKSQFIIDCSVRFEHLVADLAKLMNTLGMPFNANEIPHAKSGHRPLETQQLSDFYDPPTTDVVRRRMSWVFENYDYSEDPRDFDGRTQRNSDDQHNNTLPS